MRPSNMNCVGWSSYVYNTSNYLNNSWLNIFNDSCNVLYPNSYCYEDIDWECPMISNKFDIMFYSDLDESYTNEAWAISDLTIYLNVQSKNPTNFPSNAPTIHPSLNPSYFPTMIPTELPSTLPSLIPSINPSKRTRQAIGLGISTAITALCCSTSHLVLAAEFKFLGPF